MRERAEATNALCIAQPTFAMGDIERKEAVNRGVIFDVPNGRQRGPFCEFNDIRRSGPFLRVGVGRLVVRLLRKCATKLAAVRRCQVSTFQRVILHSARNIRRTMSLVDWRKR